MHKYDSLTRNIIKENKIKQNLLSYLNDYELFKFASTTKLLYNNIKDTIQTVKEQKIYNVLQQINTNKKKQSNTIKIDLQKSYKNLKVILNDKDFDYIKIQNKKQIELIQNNLEKSQIDFDKYSYFYSQNLNLILRLQRIWVDQSLDIIKKQVKEPQEINKEKLIAKINNNNAFDPNSHDYNYQKHKLLQKELDQLKIQQQNQKQITLKQFLNCNSYCYLLFLGGDFCLISFKNHKDIFKTSQHKYIVRAKGGGKKQSQKDRTKNIKSIGSQIRRENEKVLNQKIQEIISQNQQTLNQSDYIFLFAPSLNTNAIIQYLTDFNIDTNKVRSLASDLSKASYEQGMKFHQQSCQIQIYQIDKN